MKARPIKKRDGLPIPPEGHHLILEGEVIKGYKICCPKSVYAQFSRWHDVVIGNYFVKEGKILNPIDNKPYLPYWYAAKSL
jgi:hypothetical protein